MTSLSMLLQYIIIKDYISLAIHALTTGTLSV